MVEEDTDPEIQLVFGVKLKEINQSQLNVGDYLNLQTLSGSRYLFEVVQKDSDEEVYIKFISGRVEPKEPIGKIIFPDIKVWGGFHYGRAKINVLVSIIVTASEPHIYPELKYDEWIEEVDVSELQEDDYIYIETLNKSRYVLKILNMKSDKPVFIVIDGPGAYLNQTGAIKNPYLIDGANFRSTVMTKTSSIRKLMVSKKHERKFADVIDLVEERMQISRELYDTVEPSLSDIRVGLPRKSRDLEIYRVLKLDPENLTATELEAAWERYVKDNLPRSKPGEPHNMYIARVRDYEKLEAQYYNLLRKLRFIKDFF